jgi:hypothetical protein
LAGGLAGWERLGFPMEERFGDNGEPLVMIRAS